MSPLNLLHYLRGVGLGTVGPGGLNSPPHFLLK